MCIYICTYMYIYVHQYLYLHMYLCTCTYVIYIYVCIRAEHDLIAVHCLPHAFRIVGQIPRFEIALESLLLGKSLEFIHFRHSKIVTFGTQVLHQPAKLIKRDRFHDYHRCAMQSWE